MDIRGKNVLVLGGYGLVGQAVCKQLMAHEPARLVVASLKEEEALSAQAAMQALYPNSATEIVPAWGNIFVRHELKDLHPMEIYAEPSLRHKLIADTFNQLDDEVLTASFLYLLITGQIEGGKPADIVIDCVNTATGLAYQNIYQKSQEAWKLSQTPDATPEQHNEILERLLIAQYTPQLVRHVQVLYQAFKEANTQAYIKVGTSGTGGMGLNIPFTHGEEKPSRVLLSKAAMAGAHSLLIFLLARTPDGPQIVKEVKPTAAIAWKAIEYGPVATARGGIDLFDCPPEDALPINEALEHRSYGIPLGKPLENVYIDTGENGVFSLDEFKAITTLGQMMFITPQEIAHVVVDEIVGSSTGKDIVSALDASVMGPTYRAGFLRDAVLERMTQLEREHGVRSVAFEFLGPPRLSKLLFEAHLLELSYPTMGEALKPSPDQLSDRLWQVIRDNHDLRARILSIGIAILLPDGLKMLRGPQVKSENADGGWVDLTPANMKRWQERLLAIMEDIRSEIASRDSSSEINRTFPAARFWIEDHKFDIGEIAGWLFINEEHGLREKS
ncbi:MAG: short-chain dehydrogenase [Anaerolineales bacterium]|nr:short-chain dehydrogenase [Anaerolineales bacterium]